jgi:hypothetical protein
VTLRSWLLSPVLAVLAEINRKVDDMTRETDTRNELASAIAGALDAYGAEHNRADNLKAAYDTLATETDNLREALRTADSDKASAIDEANRVNDEGDADFNADQIERLRRLQPAVEQSPTGQLAPAVAPGSGLSMPVAGQTVHGETPAGSDGTVFRA